MVLKQKRRQPPLPSDELIDHVTSGFSDDQADALREEFHDGGLRAKRSIEGALGALGRDFASFDKALDFGCGCGPIMIWLEEASKSVELHGTDIDERAIEWARENIPFASFGVNEDKPPLAYPDDAFDLVFSAASSRILTRTSRTSGWPS